MFNPNVLVSPITALLDTIHREDDALYNLLLTKQNAEVVGTKPIEGEYNTIAVINDLDDKGNVTNYGRVITYNQLNLETVVNAKADVVVNASNNQEYHLLSHTANGANRNPTTAQITNVLSRTYKLPIESEDIDLVETVVEVVPPETPGLPVNPIEPPLPGVPVVPSEPVDPVVPAVPDYTPRLINCTVYDTLYTYIGGTVAVGHRNILPETPNATPDYIEKGLQIIRPLQYSETLDLILPIVEGFDDWTFVFETATDSRYIKAGVIWFKLHYNQANAAWQLHMPGSDVVNFDAVNENTLSIQAIDDTITVTGFGDDGKYISVETTLAEPLPEIGMHRITVYADNPNPRTLQFKLNSSEGSSEFNLPMPGFRTMSIAESSIVYANTKSNAVFGVTSKPVVITDAKAINYIEDTLNTYVDKTVGATHTTASITKLVQINNSTKTTLTCVIEDFNDLCLSGVVSSLTVHMVNDNDVENYSTVKYDITDVDEIAGTYTLVYTHNNVVGAPLIDINTLPFDSIVSTATPVNINVKTSPEKTGLGVGGTANASVRKYRVKHTLVFNKPTILPVISFTKETTPYTPV